ncbi:MAG: aminotransferase class V-fold PLP-dependent enzyme, partial [Rubripirellula sp.]|nr:aminotransferase class V-fold PLP-dependent enzyme [Rubripirellula sp.]
FGADAIADRIDDLAVSLDQQLTAAGAVTRLPKSPQRRSGIVTFDVPDLEPAKIRKEGIRQKVVLSCRDGGVRAAVHAYNDEHDIQRLVQLIRSMKAT